MRKIIAVATIASLALGAAAPAARANDWGGLAGGLGGELLARSFTSSGLSGSLLKDRMDSERC